MVVSWDRDLSLDGNSGTTRACNMLANSGKRKRKMQREGAENDDEYAGTYHHNHTTMSSSTSSSPQRRDEPHPGTRTAIRAARK